MSATNEEITSLRNALKGAAQQLAEADRAKILRTDLGPFSFANAEELIAGAFQVAAVVSAADLRAGSHANLNDANNAMSRIRAALQRMYDFRPDAANSGDPKQERTSIVANLEEALREGLPRIATMVAFDGSLREQARDSIQALQKGGENLAEENKRQLAATLEEINKSKEAIAASQKEAEAALANIKALAGNSAVAAYAGEFEKQATIHEEASRKWLIAAVSVGGVAALTVSVFLIFSLTASASATPPQTYQIAQIAVAKVALFSLLSYFAVLCVRNHKAHLHNNLVTRQRINALRTFEAFAAAAKDDQTKNAVLMQSCQAVFAQVGSGFVPQDSDAPAAPQIVEIVRTVSGTK